MKHAPHREMALIEDRASDWVLRRDAGLTPAEQRELQHWIEADPRHYAAFAAMESALAVVDDARATGEISTLVQEVESWENQQRAEAARQRRRLPAWFAWAALFIIGAIGSWYTLSQLSTEPPGQATFRLNPAQRTLADGSIIELNADADIEVDYTPGRRGVKLLRGEAHFAVAKDPTRPFVVTVGRVEFRAVGTAFSVRLDPQQVDLLVTEGTVAVAQTSEPPLAGSPDLASPPDSPSTVELPPPAPVLVTAGHRTTIHFNTPTPQPAIVSVPPTELSAALAWREARFEFNHTPLGEAIDLFNQKAPIKLALGDDSLASLRISGLYWTDDSVVFARLLENSLEIRAVRQSSDRIVLLRRP